MYIHAWTHGHIIYIYRERERDTVDISTCTQCHSVSLCRTMQVPTNVAVQLHVCSTTELFLFFLSMLHGGHRA